MFASSTAAADSKAAPAADDLGLSPFQKSTSAVARQPPSPPQQQQDKHDSDEGDQAFMTGISTQSVASGSSDTRKPLAPALKRQVSCLQRRDSSGRRLGETLGTAVGSTAGMTTLLRPRPPPPSPRPESAPTLRSRMQAYEPARRRRARQARNGVRQRRGAPPALAPTARRCGVRCTRPRRRETRSEWWAHKRQRWHGQALPCAQCRSSEIWARSSSRCLQLRHSHAASAVIRSSTARAHGARAFTCSAKADCS